RLPQAREHRLQNLLIHASSHHSADSSKKMEARKIECLESEPQGNYCPVSPEAGQEVPSRFVLEFDVTQSPAFREYRVRRRGQSVDRWAWLRASASHQPCAC